MGFFEWSLMVGAGGMIAPIITWQWLHIIDLQYELEDILD